jgi:tetratricopeptide (TPR) repeat protein
MLLRRLQAWHLVLLFSLSAPSCIPGQTTGDEAYQAKRHKAVELFVQGQRLEALPLLEELNQKRPEDEEVVVALAASLVDHAATLSDPQAAAKERLRARDLLERSGSTSPLAENLLQLLRQMPESGALHFSGNPAAEQAMQAGEAAFSLRNFDEAIKQYSRALEIEPKNYSAALFIGNTYDKKNDFAQAGKWYERAIHLDPNIETAYRYYADMLAKQGQMARARAMLIHAAVAEPYNRIVWRELRAWAAINNTEINSVYAGIPASALKNGPAAKPEQPPQDSSAAWRAYFSVQAEWRSGSRFKQRFPQEPGYRHTLAEESEALHAVVAAAQKLQDDKRTADLVAKDTGLLLLMKLHHAGLLDAYVLFSLGDDGIAKDYSGYRAAHREKLEEYMDKFVVPPSPGNAPAP